MYIYMYMYYNIKEVNHAKVIDYHSLLLCMSLLIWCAILWPRGRFAPACECMSYYAMLKFDCNYMYMYIIATFLENVHYNMNKA